MCRNQYYNYVYDLMSQRDSSALDTFSSSGQSPTAHLFAGRFYRQHILGTLLALNFDVPSAWRLMGVILTFLPCKVPSNLLLHKDLSQFPGHLSAIYFSGLSTPVSYRVCWNTQRQTWTSIDFLLLVFFKDTLASTQNLLSKKCHVM